METVLRVPTSSLMAMVTTLVLSVGVPIALCVIFCKRYKASVKSFLIGCGIFVIFSLILEQILHMVVLGALGEVSRAISGNVWLYALYGGIAAALFEETGRFVAMRFLMNGRLNRENALMYGAGHGGVEAILLVGITYIANLTSSFMLNSGSMDAMLSADGGGTLYQQVLALVSVPAGQFYLAGLERMIAIALHLALSVLVYTAVRYKNKRYCLALAMFFHFLVDFVAVLLTAKGTLLMIELVTFVLTAGVVYVAYRFYRSEDAQAA